MTAVRGLSAATAAPAADRHEQLRRLAHQLEGVFLNQLFQAMRASVPQDGFLDEAPGQEMFTSMLDERLADEAAARMRNDLGDALYRQLAGRLTSEDPTATPDGRP